MKKQGSVLLWDEEDLASLLSHGNPAPHRPTPTSFTSTCEWYLLTLSSLPICLSKKKKVKKIICIALKVYLCKTSTVLNCGSSDQL